MVARWLDADEPFFREYKEWSGTRRRSLVRAARLRDLWDLRADRLPPVLTVVGSKGKGTAATYAAATLTAAGMRTGLVTSPPFRTNRERVRVDGVAVDDVAYRRMADELAEALGELGPVQSDGGYLSPTGSFTISGVRHLLSSQVDVIVLEEGLGGASDEVSLFPPQVVAVTAVFEEHLGVIGENLLEIAADLLGVITPETRTVLSVPQEPEVWAALVARASDLGADVGLVDGSAEPDFPTPPGLSRMNAMLGTSAGRAMATLRGAPAGPDQDQGPDPDPDPRDVVPPPIALPGRLSVHHDGPRTWVVDAPVNERGVTAALEWFLRVLGTPQVVLLCMPDIKDVEGSLRALDGHTVVAVRAGESYLHFSGHRWPLPLLPATEAFDLADRVEGGVLALGTMSFVGEVLEHLDVPCDVLYPAPPDGAYQARPPYPGDAAG
ncbi:hypothetical protein CC117_23840 [Parafrankia colletiae]|uniref:Tetrahydrofolate synthase n=1 Tax=Parafrankia colletiae TaxID=573497 RepID=A0A1S1QE51_9ACTN|nr:hypothetical protein [Parafrankia colletiae]MCK9902886.1 hypothetical protein [Frankia sp. Cpl3]OHV33068.1 hypothetical protein CC117_23840 [Parafrankia colletiae]